MKVLAVLRFRLDEQGGHVVRANSIINLLKKEHEVKIIQPEKAHNRGILSEFKKIEGLKREIRKEKDYQIVYSRGMLPDTIVKLLPKEVKIIIDYPLDGLPTYVLDNTKYYKSFKSFLSILSQSRWYKKTKNRIHSLLVENTKQKDMVKDFPLDKVFIVPHPIDISNYKIPEHTNKVIVAMAKNTSDDLTEFLKVYKEYLSEYTLVILGSGPYVSKYMAYAKENNLNKIAFFGYIKKENIPNILSHCSVAVSIHGPAVKIKEYLASGLPVVDFTENYMIEESGAGKVCKEPEEYAQVMKTLLDLPAMRHDLGMKGRKYVTNNFSEGIVSQRLMEALK
jgi:glycosyltransferase involved in cell wall biosynthesis